VRSEKSRATLRCVVYTRVSTEHGLEQEFNSLDNQREASEAYVKSQTHDDLIGGERDDAEHEMAFDLERAADADLERAADAEKSGAELVFQPGVDAFGHGAEIVDPVVEVGHVDESDSRSLGRPFNRR
jgi:hypothetical protein